MIGITCPEFWWPLLDFKTIHDTRESTQKIFSHRHFQSGELGWTIYPDREIEICLFSVVSNYPD
jgi:hypothetical protein